MHSLLLLPAAPFLHEDAGAGKLYSRDEFGIVQSRVTQIVRHPRTRPFIVLPQCRDHFHSRTSGISSPLRQMYSLWLPSAAINAAETRVARARSGLLPKVNYSESWTRSDNAVFICGSLLTQDWQCSAHLRQRSQGSDIKTVTDSAVEDAVIQRRPRVNGP